MQNAIFAEFAGSFWNFFQDKFYTWLAQGRTYKAQLSSKNRCFVAGFHLNNILNVHLYIKEKCTLKYEYPTPVYFLGHLSSGFLTKRDSNQSPKLHKQARNLKFRL